MLDRKILFSCITLISVLSSNSNAEGFYLGGTLGQARGEVDAEKMNDRMAELGYDAKARVEGQNRSAWEIFGGYQYGDYLGVEAGYLDLGEVRTQMSGSPTDIQDYLNSANLVHPRSASGYEFAVLGAYPFNEKNSVYVRAGVLFSDSQYRANSQTDFAKRTDKERDAFIGAGYAYEFNNRWGLRLSYENYRVEDERIGLIGIGLKYKFNFQQNAASDAAPIAKTTTPEPLAIEPPTPATPAVSSEICDGKNASSKCTAQKWVAQSIDLAVQFDTNSSEIKPTYTKDLDKLADFMQQNPEAKVVIEGHTDSQGNNEHNKTLSLNRAQAICDFLVEKKNISRTRLTATGYGEDKPIADNATPEGRAKNRRVIANILSR